MSKVTKRKHVMNEALWDDYELPNENQSVVKVLKSKGNNLHEASKLIFLILISSGYLKSHNQNLYSHTVQNNLLVYFVTLKSS